MDGMAYASRFDHGPSFCCSLQAPHPANALPQHLRMVLPRYPKLMVFFFFNGPVTSQASTSKRMKGFRVESSIALLIIELNKTWKSTKQYAENDMETPTSIYRLVPWRVPT